MTETQPNTSLSLRHPSGSTEIRVGCGLLADPQEALVEWLRGRTVFLVSSAEVLRLHGDCLISLREAAGNWVVLEAPDGEPCKSIDVANQLWRDMVTSGGKRDSRLIAFGGGTVGDLGGFVAGTFLRGIEYAQIPTTLLAMVDAAIGGKTAIDLAEGKNTVGLFHHPRFVLSDCDALSTLPPEELRSGLVEIIKMAALLDVELFEMVERHLDELLGCQIQAFPPVVAAAAAAKTAVVERDPCEGDERRLLNFGHTLGHALEAATKYSSLRHGEAVAYGILFALRLARSRGLEVEVERRIVGLLSRLQLPALPELSSAELLPFLGRDKKVRESGWAWILPTQLGRGEVATDIRREEVEDTLPGFLDAPWANLRSLPSSAGES